MATALCRSKIQSKNEMREGHFLKTKSRSIRNVVRPTTPPHPFLLQDQWWKKVEEWEEERGRLVSAKQEAERASGSAKEDLARVLAQVRTRML